MTCMGDYEITPHVYGACIEKKKCIRTKNRLENGFMYLY